MSLMSCGGIVLRCVDIAGLVLEGLPFGLSRWFRKRGRFERYGYNHPDGSCDWGDGFCSGLPQAENSVGAAAASSAEDLAQPLQSPYDALPTHPKVQRKSGRKSQPTKQQRAAPAVAERPRAEEAQAASRPTSSALRQAGLSRPASPQRAPARQRPPSPPAREGRLGGAE